MMDYLNYKKAIYNKKYNIQKKIIKVALGGLIVAESLAIYNFIDSLNDTSIQKKDNKKTKDVIYNGALALGCISSMSFVFGVPLAGSVFNKKIKNLEKQLAEISSK